MADVASTGQPLTPAAHLAVAAARRWMFALEPVEANVDRPPMEPDRLADLLTGGADGEPGDGALREDATAFLTVMAFLDGVIDSGRIERVLAYGEVLAIDAPFLAVLADVARGRLPDALEAMVRDNLESIRGRPWAPHEDVAGWLQPYRGPGADPALARRYRALEPLPPGSFGREFLEHFDANGYRLPGEPEALQERFVVPHDASHVLAGYDTSPRGEILVSTFTAGMHPLLPISGHILPVIFSWHLGMPLNDVAGAAVGALDPVGFWEAWARGRSMAVDLFDPSWDFWAWVERPLMALRHGWLKEPGPPPIS